MSESQKQPSPQPPTTHNKTRQDTRRQASRKGKGRSKLYREREEEVGGRGGGERMEDGWMEDRERLEAR